LWCSTQLPSTGRQRRTAGQRRRCQPLEPGADAPGVTLAGRCTA
jgi:hypothetical protein